MLNCIDDDTYTEGKDEDVLDISALNGFFTDLVISGLVLMPPSPWSPAVLQKFRSGMGKPQTLDVVAWYEGYM